jgi:DNA topoisomerase-1
MSGCAIERTTWKIEASNHSEIFTASGEVLLFEGFLKVYLEGHDDDEESREGMLPCNESERKLQNNYITATERYLELSSASKLWQKIRGIRIGRPSTYVPTTSSTIPQELC